MTASPPRRGRSPESFTEARERDSAVLVLLTVRGPMTRNALAEALGGIRTSLVWNSLNRLRNQGKIRTCLAEQRRRNEVLWSTAVNEPCP